MIMIKKSRKEEEKLFLMTKIIIIINDNSYFITVSHRGWCELILKPELYSITFIHNFSMKEFSVTSRPKAESFIINRKWIGGKVRMLCDFVVGVYNTNVKNNEFHLIH